LALLPELTIQLVLMRFGALMIVAAVQGFVVAAVAVALGDPGPRYDARLSPSPFAHLDLFGSLAALVFGLAWSKPVAIDPALLRGGRPALVLPVLAAVAALVLVALALRLVIPVAVTGLPYAAGLATGAFLRVAAEVCLASALLALLPIPPLTAGLLWQAAGISPPPRAVQALSALLLVATAFGLLHRFVAAVAGLA
jgi:hypothetical protein